MEFDVLGERVLPLVQAEDWRPGVLLTDDMGRRRRFRRLVFVARIGPITLSKYATYTLVTLPGVAVFGLFDDPPAGLPAKVGGGGLPMAGHGVVKGSPGAFALNSQGLRGWRAPCGLQVLDLQYVCTAAGLTRCHDSEYRYQSKAEEKDLPA
jgi:hypothetical protein